MTDQAYNIDLLATLGVPGAGKTRALLKPIETILSDAPRAVREHFLAATKEALRLDAAPVKPARKPPKTSIRRLVRRAEAATGKTVTAITTLADGATKLDLGTGEQQQGNELDEWIAKHARAPERHS